MRSRAASSPTATRAGCGPSASTPVTCAFDEAFQIPTEFSAELAVRTQQMIAFESGIARTVDPLGGSYFLEQHTDRMEEMIVKVMDEIDAYGGVVPAIEDGWIQLRLAERGLERKLDTDSGKAPIVGQNYFRKADEQIGVGDVFKLDPTVAQRALEKFQKVLDTRSQTAVDASLAKLSAAAAKDNENVMPYLVECCHAYATAGEMVACRGR
ncbi:MAG TPA: methylmalonyl-CoA mutase family protein [Ramlibacter sp.]|nr:methylmalonyl-CoA mutase family protein [Ramlibacter sp.]